MADDFAAVFSALKPVLSRHVPALVVTADTPAEYNLHSRVPSPFSQHKGAPLFFASVRVGKAYVSFHLLPLYMDPALNEGMLPALRKRMQGKACFNFKKTPEPESLSELERLTEAGLRQWTSKGWV